MEKISKNWLSKKNSQNSFSLQKGSLKNDNIPKLENIKKSIIEEKNSNKKLIETV